jgi:hypothetical protein
MNLKNILNIKNVHIHKGSRGLGSKGSGEGAILIMFALEPWNP